MIPLILYGSMAIGAKIFGVENVFDVDTISIASVAQSLGQYIVGSVALAAIAGASVGLISFILMALCKRKNNQAR